LRATGRDDVLHRRARSRGRILRYQLRQPGPDPSKGVAISLQGKDLGKNTQCGRQLTDVTWSYLSLQCAPPQTSASADKAEKKAG
jgi:hypothetical protein